MRNEVVTTLEYLEKSVVKCRLKLSSVRKSHRQWTSTLSRCAGIAIIRLDSILIPSGIPARLVGMPPAVPRTGKTAAGGIYR